MRKLIKCIKGYELQTILSPVFIVGEVLLEVWLPQIMAAMVDKAIPSGNLNLVAKLGCLMIIFSVVSLSFGGLAGWCASVASAGFAKNIRKAEFEAIQNFSFANIDKFSTGSLITRLTTDISYAQSTFSTIIRGFVRSPIMFITALISTYGISQKMFWLFMIVIPVLIIGLTLITMNAFPNFKKLFKRFDSMNTTLQENLIGVRVVKTYVREDYETKKFKEQSALIKKFSYNAEKFLALNGPLMSLCMYTCTIFIFLIGGKEVVNGAYFNGDILDFKGLTYGQLSTLFNYQIMLLNSLMMISMFFVMMVMSKESINRIIEVLNELPDIKDGTNTDLLVEDGSIDFDNVSFSYCKDENKLALSDVNLHINSGETIGIIGGTGSSKTTLVQLLPRFYDVTKGTLSVSGHNVKEYTLKNLRDAVSMVLQKNVLFSGTIRDNLKWGNELATDEEILEACKQAQAYEFISSLPNGLDTDLGQGGVNVSGGQKQRLCIARALLKNPKIIILDDSTSAVDTKTDALIRMSFKRDLPSITKIIIAQRISSIEDADRIIVLDDGKIVGLGTHEELLKTNEIYQDVYYSQVKGDDKDE